MICRITGRLIAAGELTATLETAGGICYELLIPRSADGNLLERRGAEITLHTFQYIEGNPTGSNFIPRLLGFLSEADREFFTEFTKVKGVGMRKALRAMALPSHQIAAAIESGDERLLVSLPEIGKKLAAQICTELRGKLLRFCAAGPAPAPVRALTDAQRTAVEILVSWGDRRLDAERLVTAALDAQPALHEPDEIVRAAYKMKNR